MIDSSSFCFLSKLLLSLSSSSFVSSIFDTTTLLLPKQLVYNEIRIHHYLLLGYGLRYVLLFGTSLLSPYNISNMLLQQVSRLSEYAIPLIHYGFIPDTIIRWGIRIQLRNQLVQLKNGSTTTTTSTSTTSTSKDTTITTTVNNNNNNSKNSHYSTTMTTSMIETSFAHKMDIIQQLSDMPVMAIATSEANQQHYEVPTEFYHHVLGPYKKYSSGFWKKKNTTTTTKKKNTTTTTTTSSTSSSSLSFFERSELDMLELYCKRSQLEDGMCIVDLGCGWGSFTLYVMEKYPNIQITSISNSDTQREYILQEVKRRNLNRQNITIITCDVSNDVDHQLDAIQNMDRVISIEMFEHMKNYRMLLQKIYHFLKPHVGLLFIHIFSHTKYCYHFDQGWMSDHFFTGGTMPSNDMLLYFLTSSSSSKSNNTTTTTNNNISSSSSSYSYSVLGHWIVNGTHYERTSNAWLHNLDQRWSDGTLQPILIKAYGDPNKNKSDNDHNNSDHNNNMKNQFNNKKNQRNKIIARTWYINWRLFFMACAELWGLDHGQEYIVSHYLFQKQ